MATSAIDNATFITKTYTYTTPSIAAGDNAYVTAANLGASTPTGYRAFAVVYVHSSAGPLVLRGFKGNFAQSTETMVWLRNVGTAANTTTVTLRVVYAPSSLVNADVE